MDGMKCHSVSAMLLKNVQKWTQSWIREENKVLITGISIVD